MELSNYKHRGTRAIVMLQELQLNSFYYTWKQVKQAGISVPVTDDANYESWETVLLHVLKASGNFLSWVTKHLNLNDPEIPVLPNKSEIEEKAEEYLNLLQGKWRLALADLSSEQFRMVFEDRPVFLMLEHSVVHPLRHEFQLKELLTYSNMNVS